MSTATIIETLAYVKRFSGTRLLIKLGGSILDDQASFNALCKDLALIRSAGISLVIVHGGSKAINKELTRNNIPWKFHQGLRITTPAMMDVIEMIICGQVNRQLVRRLTAEGVAAIGLSGSDNKMLLCKPLSKKYGRVGTIEHTDPTLMEHYLNLQIHSSGQIPVIAPIGIDLEGNAYNLNADWVACKIAHALKITKLIYVSDQDGIYDENNNIISELGMDELTELIESGIVTDGMMTKVKTIVHALELGIDNIHVINGRRQHALIEELYTNRGVGTICKKRGVTCYS